MLKSGVVHIGKPNLHLHELICIALYLDAPIALSDESSYQIAKKFSEIIPVIKLSEENNFVYFTSSIEQLFTNLQPHEISPFFLSHPEKQKLLTYHLIEEDQKPLSKNAFKIFCSSFSHNQALTPTHCDFVNLGNIGYLSYQKHRKILQKIALSYFSKRDDAKFYMTQITDKSPFKLLKKEETLDQIQFLNTYFEKSFNHSEELIPGHGLIDAFVDLTMGCIFYDERFTLLTTNHFKPFFRHQHITGFYQEGSSLVSLLPQDPQNLVNIVETYFDFETLNRSQVMENLSKRFFHKAFFSQQ